MEFYKISLIQKEIRFGQPKAALESVQNWGNVVKGYKPAAVRQTSAGESPSAWQRGRHSPHRARDPCPPWGVWAVMGVRGALPVQAGLCTQKDRTLLLSPGLQGCDRQFFNASLQFTNMDRVMEEVNKFTDKHGIRMKYASLGNYFRAVHAHRLSWKVRDHQDFLPYSSGRSRWLRSREGFGVREERGPQLSACSGFCLEPARGPGGGTGPDPPS